MIAVVECSEKFSESDQSAYQKTFVVTSTFTAQKMKFYIKNFFSKSLMENFIFQAKIM